MKNVHVIVLGGTIVYQKGQDNNKNAVKLLSDIGDSVKEINITAEDMLGKASSAMTIIDLFAVAKRVNELCEQELDGIVVVQGTDTIEETAFILDLMTTGEAPVVVTGAMRHVGLLGADGGANLKDAIVVAASQDIKGVGCVVVSNGEIHAANNVQKKHTQNVAAFQSDLGPIGIISEGTPRVLYIPRREKNILKDMEYVLDMEAASIYTAAVFVGEDGRLLKYLKAAGYQGVVIQGMGGGHVSTEFAENLHEIIDEFPIILASRTGGGEILQSTYEGYPGSEVELLKRGLISAGMLTPSKSRILLSILVTANCNRDEIEKYFKWIGQLGGTG